MAAPPPPILNIKTAPKSNLKVRAGSVKPIGPPLDEPLDLTTPLQYKDIVYWKYEAHAWTTEYQKQEEPTVPQQLKSLSYNVEGIGKDKELTKVRFSVILSFIEAKKPHMIGLQEISEPLLDILKESKFIQEFYFLSTIDKSSFPSTHGIVTLSTFAPNKSFVHELHSNGNRVFDVIEILFKQPAQSLQYNFTFATYHLEGPRNDHEIRKDQLNTIYGATEGADSILFTGDSNIHAFEDFPLKEGFIDVWNELYPGLDGWTYDSVANGYCDSAYKNFQPDFINQHRLDRFILKSDLFRATKMELLGTSCIGGDPNIFPSDHFGIYAEFGQQ